MVLQEVREARNVTLALELLQKVDDFFLRERESPDARLKVLLALYGPGSKPHHKKNTTPAGLGHECGLGLHTTYEAYAFWYCPCHGQIGEDITATTILQRMRAVKGTTNMQAYRKIG